MTETYLDAWSKKRATGQLNLLQKALIALSPKPEMMGLLSGLNQNTAARIADVSHWNGDIDVPTMRDQGDVAMLIAKASDGAQVRAGDPTQTKWYIDDWFDRNCQKAYDAHIPFAPYHYVQPYFADYTIQGLIDWNWKVLKDSLANKIPDKSYHAYMFDFEEKTASDMAGSDVMWGLINRALNDADINKVPLILYTSMSVLNHYPSLIQRIGKADSPVNLFMAQWVYTTAKKTTWADVITNIIPKIDMRVLTPGNATWQMLQWCASLELPGCNGALDLSFFKGEKWRLAKWLSYTYDATPETPPDGGTTTPPGNDGTGNTAPVEVTKADFDALVTRVAELEHWRKS